MIISLAGAVALLVGAGIAVWFGRRSQRRARAMTSTATVRCSDVPTLPRGEAAVLAACNGRAEPGAAGVLVSPWGGQPCVGYRSTTSEHYWDWQTRKGRRERVRRVRTVANDESDAPFRVTDDSGSVNVDVRGARVDRPRKVYDQFDNGRASAWTVNIGGLQLENAIGFQRQEWGDRTRRAALGPGRRGRPLR
ncbi:MAG: GIDE domain-containing protein [Acidimicrobiales bacterium]